jgi:hypothetical protein
VVGAAVFVIVYEYEVEPAEHDRRFHWLHATERRLGSYEPVERTRP